MSWAVVLVFGVVALGGGLWRLADRWQRGVVACGAALIAVDLFPWVLGLAVRVALAGAAVVAVGVVAWRKRARARAWLSRRQQRLSDRLHVKGEKFAAEAGWTVTASTGRFGFGARTYRDPRFDQRRADG